MDSRRPASGTSTRRWELKSGAEFSTGVNLTREGVVEPFEIYPGVSVPAGTYDHQETQLNLQSNEGAAVSGRLQVTRVDSSAATASA